MNIQEFIDRFGPCDEAKQWLLTQPDLQSAWNSCVRSDWMLWAAEKLDLLTEQKNAALSAAFVRETPLGDGRFVVDLLPDDRLLAFLTMKEAWGSAPEGSERPEGWAAALDAALDAARDAAWDPARDAARDAARAAAWAAAWAARDAAWAAWDAARAVRAAALDAVRDAGDAQCNTIRRFVPSVESPQ